MVGCPVVRVRDAAGHQWRQGPFAEARQRHYAGIAILIQTDIYAPFERADGGYPDNFLPQLDANNGYTGFFGTLVQETHNFNGEVLLVHGDSHYFRIDKPMYEADGTVPATAHASKSSAAPTTIGSK